MPGPAASSHTPVTFRHITLDTGHDIEHRDFIPAPDAIPKLLQLQDSGHYELMDGRYRLIVTWINPGNAAFSVHNESGPLVICHACMDSNLADGIWDSALSRLLKLRVDSPSYDAFKRLLSKTAAPLRKPNGLFIAVSLEPAIVADIAATDWLGDCERCLYWTLHQRSRVKFGR